MPSTVYPVRRALFDLVRNSPDLTGVQVTVGEPTELEEQTTLSMLGVPESTEEEANLGGNRKRERYSIEWKAMAFDPAARTPDEALALEERLQSVIEVLRSIVHGVDQGGDRTINGAVEDGWASISRRPEWTGARPAAESGYVAFASVVVEVNAAPANA